MRILLSNDDGIMAEGIRQLRMALERVAEVVVVAPNRERSGVGHGITVDRPLRVQKISFPNSPTLGYAVDGTPVDCVKLGLEQLLPELPDLLVSGINQGANLATDVLYSGTVSAAFEGSIYGIPSLAVSLCSGSADQGLMNKAALYVAELVAKLQFQALPQDLLLNMNYPAIAAPKGLLVTRLGERRYKEVFDFRTDPRGNNYYWLAGYPVDANDQDLRLDVTAIKEGFISITPLQSDVTAHKYIELVEQLMQFKQ